MAVDFELINQEKSLPIYQCSAFSLGYSIEAFRPAHHDLPSDLSRAYYRYEFQPEPPNEVIERSIYIHQSALHGKIVLCSFGTDGVKKEFLDGQLCWINLHSFWYFCKRQKWKVPGWQPHNINWQAEALARSAPTNEQESTLDPADLPIELDAANMAYRAVLNGHGSETDSFKNRLIDYLKTRYPHFTNDAVLRIATVANPDKAPGRKKQNRE